MRVFAAHHLAEFTLAELMRGPTLKINFREASWERKDFAGDQTARMMGPYGMAHDHDDDHHRNNEDHTISTVASQPSDHTDEVSHPLLVACNTDNVLETGLRP